MKRIIVNIYQTGLLQRLRLLLLIAPLALISCREDEIEPTTGNPVVATNPLNEYVNDWIHENMEYWYLWNYSIPGDVDKNLPPDQYFTALLDDADRFSWIQDNYQELLNSLEGINKEAGFEYVLYRESAGSENVVAQVMYVKENSPASAAGLKRGDLITKVNGKSLTTSNYKSIIKELKEDHTLTYKTIDPVAQTFGTESTIVLSTVEYTENPHYLSKVISIENRKIGYYVYNFFANGESNSYDLQMDNIFAAFKSAGITDLILDLRFNSGGAESSARNLASLVGAGIDGSSIFLKRQYNPIVNKEILNNPKYGESFLNSLYQVKSSNVGPMLSAKRVYILTSSRTASASELVINSLKPYMEVFLIGDVTYGKNVGSISLYEENDTKNRWGLQPIVVKVANSLGSSDYGNGFVPDIENKDNSFYIFPLGDEREVLLAEALAHITGRESPSARKQVTAKAAGREMLGHSLDENARSFRLLMDKETIPSF